MADNKPTFDIFGPSTKDDIKVGYISTDRGYVQLVDLCEANRYAKYNPGTTFIYENRDKVLYLDINDVNDLDPSILLPESTAGVGTCGGLQLESPCTNETVANFYGGGGVGVLGNPIIGKDGAVLAVDLIEGGFGYQYPPIVEVKNGCDIGDGALFQSVLSDEGYTLNILKYYDECPGLIENLKLCEESPVEKAGWGRVFNAEGVDIGPWDPSKYTDNILADPIDLEMEKYKKELAEFKNPFWTTRSNTPVTISSEKKVSSLKYDVYGWWWGAKPGINPKGEIDNLYIKLFGRRGEPAGIEYWENDLVYGSSLARVEEGMKLQREWEEVCFGECKPNMPECTYLFGSYWEYDKENFMNKFAVSPEPMSNVLGTDGAGKMYSLEWNIDFPRDGNYVFIVQCDNEGTLFVDGEKQSEYNIGAGGAAGNTLSPPTKKMVKMKKGTHPVRFDLVNLMKKKKVIKRQEGAKTNRVDFKTSISTWHGATASIEELDIYVEKKFGPESPPPQDFNREVEYGRIYDVVLTSNTFRSEDTPRNNNQITYANLHDPENGFRWISPTRIEFDEDPFFHGKGGWDCNASFTIDNVVGGTATFNQSGKSIDFKGKEVKVTLTFSWSDATALDGYALDLIKVGDTTWTWDKTPEGSFTHVKPDGTLSTTDGKQPPWVKSYQNEGDTNWISNPKVGFLRDYAVFPVHDGTQNGIDHTGIWYIDVKTAGNYTLELMSDDTSTIKWDGDLVGKTRWVEITGTPKEFTINNISVGKHQLTGIIKNNAAYGRDWSNNPGGLAWTLKDPSGTIVATSLDPFNDPSLALRSSQGSETHTITLGTRSVELGSDASASVKLRTKGENVLQMEDIPHVPIEDQKILFDDVILTASQGRFFDIEGNKAKYTLPAPLPVDLSSTQGIDDELKVFDTLSFIDKASRKLWKTNNLSPQQRQDSSHGFSNRYGVTPFNPTIEHSTNYPGFHKIVWTNIKFPITAEYDITIAVDDNVRLRIGDQVDITKQGFAFGKDAITYDSFASAGAAVGQGKFRSTGTTVYRKRVKEGTYTLTADLEQIPGGKYGMSANAMLLAIDIRAVGTIETEVEIKSWNQNPFAVSMAIEAPPPEPPLRLPPDDSDGKCPTNPIWSTILPGSSDSWYPCESKPWSEFTNMYALSPVAPLDTPGSDGVGALYKNSWKMSAPYAGYYILKGTVEDTGKLFVDGKQITKLVSPTEVCKKIPSTKIYLTEGTHTIDVEVENKKDYETPKFFIDQKIFNTQDWQNQVSRPSGITKDLDFKITTSTWHGATASIEALGIYHDKKFGPEYDPPKSFRRTVEYGRIYDVVLTSNTFRTATAGSSRDITYINLYAKDGYRWINSKRIEFDEDPNFHGKGGWDCNASLTIDNVVGGTATFNKSGKSIDFNGTNVKVTLTFSWSDATAADGYALDQVKIGSTTWTWTKAEGEGLSRYKDLDGKLSLTDGKQNPWVKSYQNEGDTNWISNPKVGFLRDYAVFPVHNGTQNGITHTGAWFIDIVTPGNYTLELMSDDNSTINWDGDYVGDTRWSEITGTPKSFTINNVPVGKHQLVGTIMNNAAYGRDWSNNPGGLAWTLKDPSGTVVATSLDPFNDPGLPARPIEGSETHTITLTSQEVQIGNDMTFASGSNPEGIQLRTKGDTVLQMEDIPHVPIEDQKILFDDVIMTASEGKFFGINGNKAKFVLPELQNTNLDRGGVTYSGPALYNYKFRGYGEFLNKNGVSPDYPKFGGGEIINYEWSNVDFPKDAEYDFHFSHDAHGSLFLDGKEMIKGDFDNVAGVSAQDSANWNPGIKRKIKVSKGKHTITVAPAGQTTFGANRIESERYGWTDGLFKKISDDYYRGQQAFDNNPSAMALGITIKTETKPEFGSKEEIAQRGKSWKDNPTAISAIMIPPPCPKKMKGKGVVVDVIVDDPGGPYPTLETPPEISYPVTLRLKKVTIGHPGINYDPGDNPIKFPPYDPEEVETPLPPESPPGIGTPATVSIDADPPVIKIGNCTVLNYTSDGNTKVVITPTVGEVPAIPKGSVRVCPSETTTYTITGDGDGGGGGTGGGSGSGGGDGGGGGGEPTDTTKVEVIDGGDPKDPPGEGGGDEITVDPPNGAKLTPVFGPHGTVVGVNIDDPGLGFTEYPTISMPSDTGIGVVFKPQFEIIRDPLDVVPDKLLQVTDLVGLKQTGYVDGRAYYGAVFFDNDVKYAGMYETIGQKIRVYDTMQDSIDAMDRSDPSAIQRSGTDVSSNDPRLDIPNTPDNLI